METTPVIDCRAPAVILSGTISEISCAGSLNEAALALTRSLGRHRVPVYRFHPDQSLADLRSRYCTHVLCPNLYDSPGELLEKLIDFAKKSGSRPVLFPASDGSAKFIAENEDDLRAHYVLTCPPAACVARVQNKESLLKAARAAKISIPETYFPTSMTELAEIARTISFPVIIKPLRSADWKSSRVKSVLGAVKALRAEDPVQLADLCRKVLWLSTPFMVQEIIPGPEENLLTFIGYIGDDGRALAGCVRKKLRQLPADFGYCVVTDTVNEPEIMELSIRLLTALDYRGVACVEFKRDARTGEAKLVEINTRAVRTSALPIAAGVDFPWIAYRDATNPGSIEPSFTYEVPVRWVHLYDELRCASDLMLHSELTLLQWVGGFRGKTLVTAEFSWDDIVPAMFYWSRLPGRVFQTLVRYLSRAENPRPSLDTKITR